MSAPEPKVAVSRIPSRICLLQLTIPEWPNLCPSWCHSQAHAPCTAASPSTCWLPSSYDAKCKACPTRSLQCGSCHAIAAQQLFGHSHEVYCRTQPDRKGIRSFSRLHANGFRTCPQHSNSASSDKPYQCEICATVEPSVVSGASSCWCHGRARHAMHLKLPHNTIISSPYLCSVSKNRGVR